MRLLVAGTLAAAVSGVANSQPGGCPSGRSGDKLFNEFRAHDEQTQKPIKS
jgi:hypothetical protein